jgi:hypothetical protein
LALAVVEAVRLAGLEDAHVETERVELGLTLEADRSAKALGAHPSRVGEVHDEPAFALRHDALRRLRELGLGGVLIHDVLPVGSLPLRAGS